MADVLEDEGSSVAHEIRNAGGEAEYRHLDVTRTEEAEAVVADVEERYRPIGTVVANACILRRVPLDRLDDEQWDHILDVGLKGIMRMCRAGAPGMRRARSGSIVAFSSIMGVAYGAKGSVRYSAAKAGIVGLVRGLAVELARDGIRVNDIAPGYTRTAQSPSEEHSSGPERLARVTEYIPLGRVGNPEDIADVTVFLASDAARYLTGQVLVVEGGLLVGRY